MFSGKMEGMLNDLAIGLDHQADFEKHLVEHGISGVGKSAGNVELTVQILTTGHWPSFANFDLNLPPAMVKCVQVTNSTCHE